jgi:hypothetical protein
VRVERLDRLQAPTPGPFARSASVQVIGSQSGARMRLERRALRRGPLPEPVPQLAALVRESGPTPYRELLRDRRYRARLLLLIAMWFTGYATVFGYSTGSTVVLATLGFTASVAGMISAVGGIGFLVQGLSGFLVVAAVIAQFTPRTRNRALEDVSP